MVFEDSLNGVMAALSAGMHVVWIPDPREPPGNPDIDLLPDQWPTGVKRLSSMTEFRPEEYELPPFRE
ncbi:unnamed protein product [Protopolystoma xenopodis]|uniref:Uncharacterized protein n=1 Tax=Protopolystoma xenopodis TaxID=117903 RepID=A0A3S5B6Z5_9PLAT|nr:unnamed protein product [Protopolystoma xenopodis]